MPGPGSIACPKPQYGKQRRRQKRREERQAAGIVQDVRQHDVDRDGFCRLNRCPEALAQLGPHGQRSEWAHLGDKKRHKTRGLAPEDRHTTEGTAMICDAHHRGRRGYDGHAFEIEFADPKLGADGPLIYVINGQRFDERDVRSVV